MTTDRTASPCSPPAPAGRPSPPRTPSPAASGFADLLGAAHAALAARRARRGHGRVGPPCRVAGPVTSRPRRPPRPSRPGDSLPGPPPCPPSEPSPTGAAPPPRAGRSGRPGRARPAAPAPPVPRRQTPVVPAVPACPAPGARAASAQPVYRPSPPARGVPPAVAARGPGAARSPGRRPRCPPGAGAGLPAARRPSSQSRQVTVIRARRPRASAAAASAASATRSPLLAQGLRGQPHRAGRHGRLHPDAVGVPVRARGAVHRRPRAALRGAAGVRARGPAADLPVGGRVDALGGLRRLQQTSTDRGDRRRRRLDLVRLVVLGRARHRVLPHLPLRVPHLGPAEGVRARDVRGRAAVRRRHASSCRRVQALLASGARDLPLGLSDVKGLVYGVTLAIGVVAPVRHAVRDLPARAEGADAVGRRLAGRARRDDRDRHRRPRLPALPGQRLDAADRHLGGVRADRARLVLRDRADRARRRGRQRAALRARLAPQRRADG